jgi:hypothetical protein
MLEKGESPMKARLVPLFFPDGRDEDFDIQLANLHEMLSEDVEILEEVPLGAELPETEAVVFPQLLGEAYHMLDAFRAIDVPILLITSEFGTMLMWDWEIANYLQAEGIETIAPYNLGQTKMICRALAVKRELKETKFLVFQDNPGEGFQAEIFKRFYWWEDECIQRMFAKFGVTLVKKSFRELGARAQKIPDSEAGQVLAEKDIPIRNITPRALKSAVKIYIALKEKVDQDESIRGVGINCLNESRFSDTTPCLAWSMLYEERQLIWGCEADTMSMITKYILHKSLDMPIMMTNLYPFLMGQAALKHERIPHFPEVEGKPENYVLVAHCGYLGVLPVSFSTEWALSPKVLAIVDENATVIDARMPEGPVTLAKMAPTMEKLSIVEGDLTGYVQYPDSDCLTGGVIKVSDGHRLVTNISSHHYLLLSGHDLAGIEILGKIFGLEIEVL